MSVHHASPPAPVRSFRLPAALEARIDAYHQRVKEEQRVGEVSRSAVVLRLLTLGLAVVERQGATP